MDLANIYSCQSKAAADPNLSVAGLLKAQHCTLARQLEVNEIQINALKSQLEQSTGSSETGTQIQGSKVKLIKMFQYFQYLTFY